MNKAAETPEIVNLSANALSSAIKSKQVSCVEVMNAYLDHVDRLNPRVNAVVSLLPRQDLLGQARTRDAQLARAGRPFGGPRSFPPGYDQAKTCGGSSGGAAVALALRMLPVADGSDNGGSIRNPAAFNNVFGLRTSFGRVPSLFNEVFMPSISVHGPMARTVPDLAMFLSVIAGYDARTPLSIRQDPAEFAGPLGRDFKGTRIGWVGDFGGHIPFESGVLDLCKGALKVFEALGCTVEPAIPDYPLEPVWDSWCKIRAWQIGAMLNGPYADPAKRALMKPELQWEIENGLKAGAFEIADALTMRTAWYQAVRRFFEKYDFMIAPAGQVFPFDAALHWPKEVGGASMDTYHRWMQVMIPISMSGCPALSAPAGFNEC